MLFTAKPHHRKYATTHDHYAEITAQVIAALEAGTPPWRQQWDASKTGGPQMAQNAVTGARYRGINCLVLGISMLAFSSGDPRWATYKQASDRGWQVRKGSRGTTGFFYKKIEIEGHDEQNDEDRTKTIPMLRAFTLFHASQIDGIPEYVPPSLEEAPWREPEAVATIVRNSGAVIRFGGEKAFYSPLTDHIQLPIPSAFQSAAALASVECHELAHWSGAESRLNRNLKNKFGSHDYAREELRVRRVGVIKGVKTCLLDSWKNPCVPDLPVPKTAETSKGERDHSMSGQGSKERSHRNSGESTQDANGEWLDCLNPSPQGVILHGGASMADASHRIDAGMLLGPA